MPQVITDLLRQYPCLRPYLEKVCRRVGKQGELKGTLILGENVDQKSLAALRAFFGLRALSLSQKGAVRLSWARFFEGRTALEVEEWISDLHQGLGLFRENHRQKMQAESHEAMLLVERLRLAYPELSGVHQHLNATIPALAKQLARQGKTVAERVFKAAEIISFLRKNKEPLTFSELGAQFQNDSKALRDTELSRLIASWLICQEEAEDMPWQGETEEIWQRYHVVRDRLAVQATIFGPLLYAKNNQTYDWILRLWQAGEPATLSWANITGMDRLWLAPGHEESNELFTIENETPFARLVRERHNGILIYTSGFPNDSVLALYRLLDLPKRCHWGDSDLAGLRIAAIFHAITPLVLWRCDRETLRQHEKQLIQLAENQARQISNFLEKHPDFPFSSELRFTLAHGWLEQESWRPDNSWQQRKLGIVALS